MIIDNPIEKTDDCVKVTDDILKECGMSIKDSGGKVTFAGEEPVRKTVMKAGASAACVIAANAVADAAIWKARTGEGQDIHVDLRKAWIEQSPWQLDAIPYTTINGVSKMFNLNMFGTAAPIVPTSDGRWMSMCPLYPSQEHKILNLLNCGPAEDQIRAATMKRTASEMEEAAMVAQVPFHMIRTQAEFKASEHFAHHSNTPLIHVEKIGESEPEPLPSGERCLSGLRVLNMVHAVAGPCVQRALTAQGADALNLNMPDWVEFGNFFFQADVGMRQAYLDARKAENRPHVYGLIKDADVFVDNLRPGVCDKEGYSHEELAERRPGIIACSVKMNTHSGPWALWPGFDVNAAAIAGVYTAEGTPDQPMLPQQVNVICDIMTGYLGAIGIKAALLRRAKEGGSYSVRVSLTQCVSFILSLGLNNKEDLDNILNLGPEHQIMKPNLVSGPTPFGDFTRVGSQIEGLKKTPQFWADPMLYVPGSGKAEWLPKK